MKIKTRENVPAIEKAFLGENGMNVSMDIIRKYTLDARLNCWIRLLGAHDNIEYFAVFTSFEQKSCVFKTTASYFWLKYSFALGPKITLRIFVVSI